MTSRQGFTFVELMVAATMVSILFVGLGTHLRAGVIVWHQVTGRTTRLNQERQALDRLERDAAHAVVYNPEEGAYGPTLGLLEPPIFGSSELKWFAVQSIGGSPHRLVRMVRYWCGEPEGDGPSGLWMTSQSIAEVRARQEAVAQLLLAGCEAFSVRYAYLPADAAAETLEWEAQWHPDPKKELPAMAEVTVTVSGPPKRVLRRVVTIPIGVLKQKPGEQP